MTRIPWDQPTAPTAPGRGSGGPPEDAAILPYVGAVTHAVPRSTTSCASLEEAEASDGGSTRLEWLIAYAEAEP